MKLIHTSDWHLGHTLYNYDRTEEHLSFLSQLREIVREQQPDALIISGDVYHYSSPSAAVQRMYTEAMLQIHRECPEMTIVVTAGNHDSSSKLEITSCLWDCFGMRVVGSIEKRDNQVNYDRHIVEVRNKNQEKVGYILAVPHVYPQNFPVTDPDIPREKRMESFFQSLLDETQKRNTDNLPVVLMAHLAVTGSDSTGHSDMIGGMEYFNIDQLGKGYDYLALGHIHCPQTLKNTDNRARYSGSPVPVSFDETYSHSISLVTLEGKNQPLIETVEIRNPHPLVTLPKVPVPFEEALNQLKEFPDDDPSYIRLNVQMKDYLSPNCNEQAVETAKEKACRFCYIKTNRLEKEKGTQNTHLSIQELQEKSPLDIAKLYYKEVFGEELDSELSDLLQEAIRQTNMKGDEA